MRPVFPWEEMRHHAWRYRERFFPRGGIKYAILELVKEKPRHGYEIMQELEQRTGGFYCPSPGTVYPTLQSLEDQDLIRSTQEDGKRVYSITDEGLAYLESREEEVKRHQGPWHALGPETLAEGWQTMSEARWFFGDVVRALRRTAADPAKLKEIREVLRETKKAIDDIVAR